MKRKDMTQDNKARMDSYINAISGIGVKTRDRRMATVAVADVLKESEAEAIYAGDFIAAKEVDTLPEDMVREGFKLIIPSMQEEDIRKIDEYLEYNLCWKSKFKDGMSWGRLYGGAAILLGVDDGNTLDQPLDFKSIKTFDHTNLFHCWELRPAELQKDIAQPGYGLPLLYSVQPATTTGLRLVSSEFNKKIHASRLIRFDGCRLPRRMFESNQYWHDSILSKRKQALADYSHSFDSVAALMGVMAQAVFKVKNLHEIMAGEDGMELLQLRLDLLQMSRSVVNAMMIADEETFEMQTANVSGLPELLRKFEERVVSQSEYPHTILLGEGPAGGLGEQGKSELRDYYDGVSRKQETQLKPLLKYFIRAMFCDKNGPTKGIEPESWDLEFNPLWQESNSEILEQKEKQARIDDIYIRTGVYAADEVAQSRFGSGTFSYDTSLIYDRDSPEVDGDLEVTSDNQNGDGGNVAGTDVEPDVRTDWDNFAVTAKSPSKELDFIQRRLSYSEINTLLEIVTRVGLKQLSRDAAIGMMKIAFAFTDKEAKIILGSMGDGFEMAPNTVSSASKPVPANDLGDPDLSSLVR